MAFPTVNAADVPDSDQVSKLLSEAKTLAFQVKEDAETMESYSRSNVTWERHAVAIAQIKEHVNALGRQVANLDELSGYTEAVIEHINKKPKLLTTAEYKDYLEANADYSGDLAAMIGDFVDYGRTKQRMERLAGKLEVPAAK